MSGSGNTAARDTVGLNINDVLMIIQETVDWFKDTRWEVFFRQEHIGESVRYGGEHQYYSEFGTKHQLAFQDVRGLWCLPNCSLEIIEQMRSAYLDTESGDQ